MGIDVSPGSLVVMIFFSLIGMVYIGRGRKKGPMSQVVYGVTLLIFPYFVTDLVPMLLVGLGVLALSYLYSFG